MKKLKPNQMILGGHTVTEKGILFSTEMVKAILEDRKTQTRRTKGFTNENPEDWSICHVGDAVVNNKTPMVFGVIAQHKTHLEKVCFTKSPYGKPGDLLYVREKWTPLPSDMINDRTGLHFSYFADHDEEALQIAKDYGFAWKPSLHLPKSGSRIWMMIEDIRVERLHDITEEEAKAEGIKIGNYGNPNKWSIGYYIPGINQPHLKASHAFTELWESINGEDSWSLNPWVWVIKFRVLSKTGRPSDEVISSNLKEITHV